MLGVLLLTIMDWAMRSRLGNGENGFRWKFTSKRDYLQMTESSLFRLPNIRLKKEKETGPEEEATHVGFKVSTVKTKVMRIS